MMIRTILLATFLVFTTLANLICMELQLPTADPEMPWSTIGAGGVHLYAEPGLLEVRIFKRDQNSSQNTRTEMMVLDRKSTRLNSSHARISYAVFCLKKKKKTKKKKNKCIYGSLVSIILRLFVIR